MRYDVVFWYPKRGLRVGSINYVRSDARPDLGDGQVFGYAMWVAPGPPSSMLQATEDSQLQPLDATKRHAAILARLRPWTGSWDDVEVVNCYDPAIECD
jgi:hypothetical protein